MRLVKQITSAAAAALIQTPLYEPLRRLYLQAFKRSFWEQRRSLLSFYAKFVSKGSLVFDIGANNGEHTGCFLALGASVVAVEPLPSCAAKLRLIYPKHKVTVVPYAVGRSMSTARMRVGRIGTLSTLSDEWLARAKRSARFKEAVWDQVIEVPVITLDSLIQRYGHPDFVKIDVEGFEPHVLDGLSQMPRALSFEFNTEYLEATIECLRKGCFPLEAKFNYIVGESNIELQLPEWATADELITTMRKRFRGDSVQGDVVACCELSAVPELIVH